MSIASNSVRKEISKKSPSKELSEDAKNTISVIRGLIKTRKQITTVKDIEQEYLAMEGQEIPFKKLGFNSLNQLMRASGEFHLSNNNGDVSWLFDAYHPGSLIHLLQGPYLLKALEEQREHRFNDSVHQVEEAFIGR